jgi:dipeptidase
MHLKQFSHNDAEKDIEFPEGCTVILVGKKASTDGSVMVTHTADCGLCDWTFRYIPAEDHEPGSMRKIYHIDQIKTWPPEVGQKWDVVLKEGFTGLEIPQVLRTNAYIHGVFGYMNEHQLAMGESSIGCQRKMRNPTPTAKMDITMLTLLAMERCKTAREAIALMGSLAEEHGYGYVDSGEMLAVADPQEAWIFEIMPVGPLWTPESGKPGAVWCAQRIPDDHVSFCPNESRIGEIDLKDKHNFMASSNVISFAEEKELWDPESGEPFNWKKAYSPTQGSAASTQARRGRLWRLFDLVSPSQGFDAAIPNMDLPFSVKPDRELSLKDIIALMRDKYQGTAYDPAAGVRGGPFANPNWFGGFSLDGQNYPGPRCVCVNKVEYTTVAVCRDWLPDPIGGVVWLSFGAQDTSCYMPLYAGITRIPRSFSIGDHWHFDRHSARWAFDYVDFHTQVVYSYAIKDVMEAQKVWEDAAIDRSEAIDKTALVLYKQEPQLAIDFLTDYSNNNADKVVDAWWDLGNQLLVKYNHFNIYNAEKRSIGRIKFPEWWNRLVAEQDGLKPLPKAKRK